MGIIPIDDYHFPSLPCMYMWVCDYCNCRSKQFNTEAEALTWAQQPIPFLPEKQYIQDDHIPELVWEIGEDKGRNGLIDTITTALAVKEQE